MEVKELPVLECRQSKTSSSPAREVRSRCVRQELRGGRRGRTPRASRTNQACKLILEERLGCRRLSRRQCRSHRVVRLGKRLFRCLVNKEVRGRVEIHTLWQSV